MSFARLRDAVERSFRHVAEAKHLSFDIEMDPELPRSMTTDIKRLQHSSRIYFLTLSSSLHTAASRSALALCQPAGATTMLCLSARRAFLPLRSAIPVSALRRTNKKLSLRRFTRPTQVQAGALAAPVSAWRSAENWRLFWEEKSVSPACRTKGAST